MLSSVGGKLCHDITNLYRPGHQKKKRKSESKHTTDYCRIQTNMLTVNKKGHVKRVKKDQHLK